MIYLTSDPHFDNINILKHCDRPFESVDEMNDEMVRRWNGVVSKRDTVYHLGDVTLRGFPTFIKFFSQLNGRIKLLPGSHDDRWIKDIKKPIYNLPENLQILPPLITIKYQRRKIVLCHYPMHSWQGSNRGSLHFHGHCHGKIDRTHEDGRIRTPLGDKLGRRIDVGVDCWNFFPIPLDLFLKELT